MSILDSIKGTRKLSFNNWRYRLLHWTFNVKNPDPKNPASTGMPKFLYTHFCPLFHLTNLIAILSPIILFIKIMCIVFKAFVAGVKAIPFKNVTKRLPKFKFSTDIDKSSIKHKRTPDIEAKAVVNFCCEWGYEVDDSFDRFWYIHNSNFGFEELDREKVEAIFKEYYPKVIAARKLSQIKKEKLKERLIFWTNFSRVFIKWALNVFYFLLAAAVFYFMYLIAGSVWDFLCWFGNGIYWMFTDKDSLSFMGFMLGMVFVAISMIAIQVFLFRIGFMRKFGDVLGDGLMKLAPPFYLIGKFFGWIGRGWNNLVDFCKMFYEENCPPIVLVSEEEAAIESIVEQEN